MITLKSPGHNAYYYYMPVEWVQTLLNKPDQAINTSESRVPFWAELLDKWPFFMRVVQPYLTEDWASLLTVAEEWAKQEPNNAEAWFYLAAAEYNTKNNLSAESHLIRVMSLNAKHSLAMYYLGLIAEDSGKHMEALTKITQLNELDESVADQLKLAMGIAPEQQ